ncbi:MAG: hypothetical protein ABIP89_12500 [Polyangiaceae bacterium]
MNLVCTYFPKLLDAKGQRFKTTSSAIVKRFETARIEVEKKKLPGISFATFKGDLRALDNVEGVAALQLDFDEGVVFEQVRDAWANYHALLHTTYQHTPQAHRLRLFVFLSRIVTPAEYSKLWRFVASTSEKAGQKPDPNAKDASRLNFIPGTPPGGEYRFHETAGATFDVEQALAQIPATPSSPRNAPPRVSVIDRIERARRYLDKCDPAIAGSNGHGQTFAVATKMVKGFSLSEDVALDLLWHHYNQRCQPPWSEHDLRRKVQQAAKSNMPEGFLLDESRRAS